MCYENKIFRRTTSDLQKTNLVLPTSSKIFFFIYSLSVYFYLIKCVELLATNTFNISAIHFVLSTIPHFIAVTDGLALNGMFLFH